MAETTKANNAALSALQANLSLPLTRMYRSRAALATELLPYTLRMLNPDIKPVVISTSAGGKSAPTASVRRAEEKARVARAVDCMAATGVRFDKARVEDERGASGGWVYRMEPGLDALGVFETGKLGKEGVRYAVRQVLEGEWGRRNKKAARMEGEVPRKEKGSGDKVKINSGKDVKKDFFGRVVKEEEKVLNVVKKVEQRVWVSYHEGFSNAVKRPLTLEEFMRGM